MNFRLATEKDVFAIIELFIRSGSARENDPLFLDYQKLSQAIADPHSLWLVTENATSIVAVISILIDTEQRLAKISRMIVDLTIPEPQELLRTSLRSCLDYLDSVVNCVDLVYTTTLSMTMDEQEITLKENFKILGVFPNLNGKDKARLNGLTAYFFKTCLTNDRHTQFTLHPAIAPFFRISQRQCELPDLAVADAGQIEEIVSKHKLPGSDVLGPLELIRAPLFVAARFAQHKMRRSQIVNFYPFYTPNMLIADPLGEVEIFVRIDWSMRFAAVIGEHLKTAVDPVTLYRGVVELLRSSGVSYIEVINDAADLYGIECFREAGFTPCSYLPAFKRQGLTRRDYVVFGKSFEYHCRPNLDTHRAYIDFYREYFKIEVKNYFPLLPGDLDVLFPGAKKL